MRDLYGRVPKKERETMGQGDSALILALIIILLSEGKDEILILALIYILT